MRTFFLKKTGKFNASQSICPWACLDAAKKSHKYFLNIFVLCFKKYAYLKTKMKQEVSSEPR